MSINDFFKISLKKPICIPGLTEDTLRELINAIEIEVNDTNFSGFVQSTNGVLVKFLFGPDGNFSGVTAKLNSQNIPLFTGVGDKQLGIFKGPPTNNNPGSGWETEPDLTVRFLNQPTDENQWEIFFASRVAIINT